ncbi:hypothetical protein R3P38DRAFT_2831563 [Favolaschia claudopus]|uniref:Uncharacterized protein n=1 Tax=Favolaschia claudopus TaxID=2862362 RepID=A0AAW0ECB4_9AGAR
MGLNIPEAPDSPRRRDLSFFIVALFVVAPLRLVAPLSWAFVLYTLYTGSISSFGWRGKLFYVLALCEVLFSLYHQHLVSLVSVPWKHGSGNIAQLQIAFTRVLKSGLAVLPDDGDLLDESRPASPAEPIIQLEASDPRGIEFRSVLRTWFGRAPWSSIRQREVKQWLYWSIFNKDLPEDHEMLPSHKSVLDETLESLEKRLGTKIPEGSNPAASPIRMTLDKVCVYARPFFYYVLIFVVNWYLRSWYSKHWNLRHGSHKGLEYLVYIPENWDSVNGPRPTVFLHGLGLGLLQYYPVTRDLRLKFPDRPLLIPLQPHISQDIFHPSYLDPICRQDLADRLAGLMDELGWVDLPNKDSDDLSKENAVVSPGVTMVSHSNGSYLHAWCLKQHPEIITRSCFVDPVTFCSWEGDACYNFLYRIPTTGFELIVSYFVGTELGVANLLRRHFDWSSNALWYEEIPNARDPSRTFFLLGGRDDIINAERVTKYLSSHGVRKGIWYDPNGLHGDALHSGGAGHTRVMQWLRETAKM